MFVDGYVPDKLKVKVRLLSVSGSDIYTEETPPLTIYSHVLPFSVKIVNVSYWAGGRDI